jgi:hypothetical protein
MDNLAADKTPAIWRWARRENVKLCFTPANASWANPIEAQFGPVRTFVMGGSDHRGGSRAGPGHNLTKRAGVPASRHRLASDGPSWLACQK